VQLFASKLPKDAPLREQLHMKRDHARLPDLALSASVFQGHPMIEARA
jgi:hypothetical protein